MRIQLKKLSLIQWITFEYHLRDKMNPDTLKYIAGISCTLLCNVLMVVGNYIMKVRSKIQSRGEDKIRINQINIKQNRSNFYDNL